MGKVEIAPATLGDTGAALATVGASIAYYAIVAIIDGAWLLWSRAVLAALVVAAIVATAGGVLIAVDRDRARVR